MICSAARQTLLAIYMLCLLMVQACAQSLPPIPDFFLGINQPGLGKPEYTVDLSQPWALSDADIIRLKSDTGMNTIRFPLYPLSLGLDGKQVAEWNNGQIWDESIANGWIVNWKVLDSVLDQMVRTQVTPIICPIPEPPAVWITLHIPEAAERALWLTKLIVNHVHNKYGDNVAYGWYENNALASYMHDYSARFPTAFRQKLETMYSGNIASLNSAWKSSYTSFDDVQVPSMWDGKRVPLSAISNRQTYDLRKAMDMLTRDRLSAWRTELSQIAPGAKWIGGCMHDGFNGMYDTRTVKPPRCTASIMTYATTSDYISSDNYQLSNIIKVDYRTIAKIAASKGKKFMVSEVLSWSEPSYSGIVEVGGPTQGVLAWCGKQDMYGLIMDDGTRRESSISALAQCFQTIRNNTAKYSTYIPGHVYVLFPEDTYEYMLSSTSYLDAYERICDSLSPADIEPVLESELTTFPQNAYLFVLEQNLLRTTINALNRMGSRLVCPHSYFIDENGSRVDRSWMPTDFLTQLNSVQDGPSLLTAFNRVIDKQKNCVSAYNGVIARTPSMLALGTGMDHNIVWNAVDGSMETEVRFADLQQTEMLYIDIRDPKQIDGAFVQFYPGGINGEPRSVPQHIYVSTSLDGTTWTRVASITTGITADRIHLYFSPVTVKYLQFDFGSNSDGLGTRVIEVGVSEHIN